jgi:hypothetical protein
VVVFRKYGLGADQVLEIELVNADGEIITANECQNTDYFWAMRGGGGSTYGVVLTYTMKAMPTVKTVKYRGYVNGWDQLAQLHQQWNTIASLGGSGYIDGYPAQDKRVKWSVTMPNATEKELRDVIEPIVNTFGGRRISRSDPNDNEDEVKEKRSLDVHEVHEGVYTAYETFAEADKSGLHTRSEESIASPFPGMGTSKILASWLWTAEDVNNPKIRDALRNALDADTQLLNDATFGVGTHNPPFIRGGGNAVNPAFRTAIMRPAAELQWKGNDLKMLEKKKADALRFGAALRNIRPSGGTYANEV